MILLVKIGWVEGEGRGRGTGVELVCVFLRILSARLVRFLLLDCVTQARCGYSSTTKFRPALG